VPVRPEHDGHDGVDVALPLNAGSSSVDVKRARAEHFIGFPRPIGDAADLRCNDHRFRSFLLNGIVQHVAAIGSKAHLDAEPPRHLREDFGLVTSGRRDQQQTFSSAGQTGNVCLKNCFAREPSASLSSQNCFRAYLHEAEEA
jgi:hypothetical protein